MITAELRRHISLKNISHQNRIGYLFMLPPLLFMLVILGFPILYTFIISFQDVNLRTLISGERPFVGIENYKIALTSGAFHGALSRSLLFTVGSISLQFSIGLVFALLFRKQFWGANVLRGLVLSGWLIPAVVVGTLFVWLFNLDFGLINFALIMLGLIDNPVGWLVDPKIALFSVTLANIWYGIPFNVIVLSAGLAGLPEDVYEAATVDGANGFQRFRHITLPLMRQSILAVLMLGLIYTLRSFGLIWTITRGGPSGATEVIPTLAYRVGFEFFRFSEAAVIAVFMVLLLLTVAIFYVRATKEEMA
jgi:multiple sugar transport system permease protein